jgi:hypothetical protein
MFNMQKGNGKFCEVYLDELTYTVGNAPTGVGDARERK